MRGEEAFVIGSVRRKGKKRKWELRRFKDKKEEKDNEERQREKMVMKENR